MLTSELIEKLQEIIETKWDLIVKFNWVEFEEHSFCRCSNTPEDIGGLEVNKAFILIT